jgi:hypothetical protein
MEKNQLNLLIIASYWLHDARLFNLPLFLSMLYLFDRTHLG